MYCVRDLGPQKVNRQNMDFNLKWIIFAMVVFLSCTDTVKADALQITKDNYQDTLDHNKLVLINFYADWCMFSQQLAPIFHQAANIIHEEYPDVKLGRVDCESEQDIALSNGISKYPTIKLYRNGQVLKKEYRGQRSVDAFSAYLKHHLKPSVVNVFKSEDLKLDDGKHTVIGYFEGMESPGYISLVKVADQLRESMDFVAMHGDASAEQRAVGEHIVFKPKKKSGEQEITFTGSLDDAEMLKTWANDKGNPLVREITFENGEELTEEGLPFLLMFHKPDDVTSIQRFKNAVMRDLLDQRGRINFLLADGTTFSHPLHHLGKNIDDLPLICIDSFRHMYLFKNFDDIDQPGKLNQFVEDLHSGKLHQDFHNPPPEDQQAQEHHHHGGQPDQQQQQQPDSTQPPQGEDNMGPPVEGSAEPKQSASGSGNQPPETIFNKLGPSENRYTLLHWRDYSGNYRDEL